MKRRITNCVAMLLIALLMMPAALAEDISAPVSAVDAAATVEAVDDIVPEAEGDLGGEAVADFGVEDTPSYEGEWVGGDGYMSALPAYEASSGIPIDEAHFPDEFLRVILGSGYGSNESGTGPAGYYDPNHNYILEPDEIAAITEFATWPGVADLRGLEYLTALQSLTISGYTGTTLVVALPSITSLNVYNSDTLTTLDFSSCAKLEKIDLNGLSSLTTLDLSSCAQLEDLNVPNADSLTALDLSSCTQLKKLGIGGASLTTLDLTSCTQLEELDLYSTAQSPLTTLDLSGCTNLKRCTIWEDFPSLTTVICPASLEHIQIFPTPALSTLDISRCTNLKYVEVMSTEKLTSLDISGSTGLEEVKCNSDKLTSFDASKNPNLKRLKVCGNALKSVKLGNHPNLIDLECCGDSLTSLDICGCPKLLPVIKDKYKKVYKKGQDAFGGHPYAHILWKSGSVEVRVAPNAKLVTDKKGKTTTSDDSVKKSETVAPAEDNSITASAKTTKATVSVGQSYTLSVADAKASGFKSSNKKVATVTKAGKITPKNAGKVKITYKVNGKTRTVTLTIKDPTMPKSIKLDQSGTVAAKVGDKVTLTATLNEGAVSAIQWTTSDKKVATVKNGVVTFKKAGKVTITAATKRGNKKAKVKFTVSK